MKTLQKWITGFLAILLILAGLVFGVSDWPGEYFVGYLHEYRWMTAFLIIIAGMVSGLVFALLFGITFSWNFGGVQRLFRWLWGGMVLAYLIQLIFYVIFGLDSAESWQMVQRQHDYARYIGIIYLDSFMFFNMLSTGLAFLFLNKTPQHVIVQALPDDKSSRRANGLFALCWRICPRSLSTRRGELYFVNASKRQ